MTQHFWLICGLWCGIGNALFMRSRLQKHVARGEFPREGVTAFVKGLALWILVPCLSLWALQQSVGAEATPVFLAWPSPQRHVAVSIQIFLWSSLLYWVFLKGGARTLSTYYGAGRNAAFMYSPTAFKLGALAAVVVGNIALFSKHA